MADKPIRRFITLIFDKNAGAKAERETQQSLSRALGVDAFRRNFSTLAGDVTRLFAQAVVAVGGYIKVIGDLAQRGGEFLNIQRAFNNAVGDGEGALQRLRRASNGLISDFDLMREANFAFTLGSARSVEGMEELVSVSQALGRALGIDATKAMHDLSIGIGRNSKRILDNLGIIVEGAVTLESTLDAARKRIDQLGGSVGQGADKVTQFQVAFTNLRDQVGRFLSESNTVTVFFDSMTKVLDTLAASIATQDTTVIRSVFTDLGELLGEAFMGAFATAVSEAIKLLPDWFVSAIGFVTGAGGGFIAGGATGNPLVAVGGAVVGGMLGGNKADALRDELTGALDEASDAWFENVDKDFERLLQRGKDIRATLTSTAGPGTLPGGPPPISEEELEEQRKAEEARFKTLQRAHELGILDHDNLLEIIGLRRQINGLLRTGNLSLEEQVRLSERLAELDAIMGIRISGAPRELERPEERFAQMTGLKLPPMEQMLKTVMKDAPPEGFQGFLRENFDSVSTIVESTVGGMQSAWANAFLTIGEQSARFKELELLRAQKLADATTEVERQKVEEWFAIESAHAKAMDGLWEKLAKGFAASVLNGLAQVASAKVAQNIAEALAATGSGLMGNVAAFGAAAQFLAAAAAWSVLGGAAAAGASKLSSGGGTGGFAGGSIAGGGADRTESARPIVIVNVDGLDPDNPAHIRLVQRATMNGKEQWGEMKPTTQRYAVRRKTG